MALLLWLSCLILLNYDNIILSLCNHVVILTNIFLVLYSIVFRLVVLRIGCHGPKLLVILIVLVVLVLILTVRAS